MASTLSSRKLRVSGLVFILTLVSPGILFSSPSIGYRKYKVNVCVTNHADHWIRFLLRYNALGDPDSCPLNDQYTSKEIVVNETYCHKATVDEHCFAQMDARFFVDPGLKPHDTIWLNPQNNWFSIDEGKTQSFIISSDPKECKGKPMTGKYCVIQQ